MKREKRLTKREKKALSPQPRASSPKPQEHHHHIHCTACGLHLDVEMFEEAPPRAVWLRCDHHSEFASCSGCSDKTKALLEEHDRSGQPVKQASAWH